MSTYITESVCGIGTTEIVIAQDFGKIVVSTYGAFPLRMSCANILFQSFSSSPSVHSSAAMFEYVSQLA